MTAALRPQPQYRTPERRDHVRSEPDHHTQSARRGRQPSVPGPDSRRAVLGTNPHRPARRPAHNHTEPAARCPADRRFLTSLGVDPSGDRTFRRNSVSVLVKVGGPRRGTERKDVELVQEMPQSVQGASCRLGPAARVLLLPGPWDGVGGDSCSSRAERQVPGARRGLGESCGDLGETSEIGRASCRERV